MLSFLKCGDEYVHLQTNFSKTARAFENHTPFHVGNLVVAGYAEPAPRRKTLPRVSREAKHRKSPAKLMCCLVRAC